MSCKTRSKEEFAKTTPVSPPKVNKKINPKAHNILGVRAKYEPYIVPTHLNTLIPVGTAIIIVAVVK